MLLFINGCRFSRVCLRKVEHASKTRARGGIGTRNKRTPEAFDFNYYINKTIRGKQAAVNSSTFTLRILLNCTVLKKKEMFNF